MNANADVGGSTIGLHERCSGQLKMNNGECFCVNSNILKLSVAMSDPCENWESTPGLGVTCQDETCNLLRILPLGIFA